MGQPDARSAAAPKAGVWLAAATAMRGGCRPRRGRGLWGMRGCGGGAVMMYIQQAAGNMQAGSGHMLLGKAVEGLVRDSVQGVYTYKGSTVDAVELSGKLRWDPRRPR